MTPPDSTPAHLSAHRTARRPAHRRPRTRTAGVRRMGAGVAGASAVAMLATGLTATTAQAAYDPAVWDRVADCESGGRWHLDTGNGFYGGLQFYQPTWKAFGGQEYAGWPHHASKAEQIAIARRVLYTQGPGAWPVCSVRAGLTKSNGGADPKAEPGNPDPGPVTRYVSATGGANIRSGPSTDHDVVGEMPRGTEVTGTMEDGWLRLAEGRYISGSVLSESPISGVVTRYVAANGGANVRSGPGTDHGVVGERLRGLRVVGTVHNGWLKLDSHQYISGTILRDSPISGIVTRYVKANGGANVRSGPGTDYSIVDAEPRGAWVIGSMHNGWLKADNGRWLSGSVLSEDPL